MKTKKNQKQQSEKDKFSFTFTLYTHIFELNIIKPYMNYFYPKNS